MLEQFVKIPDKKLFILFFCIFIIISVLSIFIVRRFNLYNPANKYHSVIGKFSSLIGLIYAIIAGLTALYLINNITYSVEAVKREAHSVENLYRASKWLADPTRFNIQNDIKDYLNKVINVEWPIMKSGNIVDQDGDLIIDDMASQLRDYTVTNNKESLILHQMVDEIKTLYDAREQRIYMSYSALNSAIWISILIGTILTIVINYLFKISFYLHIISVFVVVLMCSSMIYLLVILDRPFQGEFVIEPETFRLILSYIEKTASA